MTLLADDHLGLAVHALHVLLPLQVVFGAGLGLAVVEVVFLAIDEHHHVRVLLDRPGFTQVRELRALVVAAFDLTRELGERDDRNTELLRQRLHARGDLGQLLNAVLAFFRGAREKLEVVHHEQIKAMLALEAARTGRELRDGNAAGLVDMQGKALHFSHSLMQATELLAAHVTTADLERGHAGLLGDDTCGELLGAHFEAEEADNTAGNGFQRAIRLALAAPGLGDVVGDVGRKRGLAHAGASGEHDQVALLQAAHALVEIGQAGRGAGEAAIALVGLARHLDGEGQRRGEALEPALEAPTFGECVKLALGLLDLLAGHVLDRRIVGATRHILADGDQRAPQCEVMHRAAILAGIRDGRRGSRETPEILRDRDAAEIDIRQIGLDGDRGRDLAGLQQLAHHVENRAVHLLVEVLGQQEVRHPVEGFVVHEDRAEQGLFGLEIVRGEPQGLVRGILRGKASEGNHGRDRFRPIRMFCTCSCWRDFFGAASWMPAEPESGPSASLRPAMR